MKKFFGEFKTFITRGNVLDMAIGIIMGSAFTAIISSLVADVFTPIINLLTGKATFGEWVIPIGSSSIAIGNFIQSIITFLLTAFCLFLIVKAFNKFKKKEEPKAEKPAEPSKEEVLLTEIRDLLKDKKL